MLCKLKITVVENSESLGKDLFFFVCFCFCKRDLSLKVYSHSNIYSLTEGRKGWDPSRLEDSPSKMKK